MVPQRTLLAITHMPTPELGLVGDAVARAGLEVRLLPRDPAARFPAPDEIAGIVSFGGQMSALSADRDPFLAAELELLRGAIAAGVPVLGLCLGAQLLAIAGGGAVYVLDRPHIAVEALDALAPASGDALGTALPPSLPVIEWHCDGILPPPDAEVLAETPGPGCSVFRVGPAAWGSQLHVEATPEQIRAWVGDEVEARSFAAAGVDPAAFAVDALAALPGQMAVGEQLVDRFVGVVRDRVSTSMP